MECTKRLQRRKCCLVILGVGWERLCDYINAKESLLAQKNMLYQTLVFSFLSEAYQVNFSTVNGFGRLGAYGELLGAEAFFFRFTDCKASWDTVILKYVMEMN